MPFRLSEVEAWRLGMIIIGFFAALGSVSHRLPKMQASEPQSCVTSAQTPFPLGHVITRPTQSRLGTAFSRGLKNFGRNLV